MSTEKPSLKEKKLTNKKTQSSAPKRRWEKLEQEELQRALLTKGLNLTAVHQHLIEHGVKKFDKEAIRLKLKSQGMKSWLSTNAERLPDISAQLRAKIRESYGETGVHLRDEDGGDVEDAFSDDDDFIEEEEEEEEESGDSGTSFIHVFLFRKFSANSN